MKTNKYVWDLVSLVGVVRLVDNLVVRLHFKSDPRNLHHSSSLCCINMLCHVGGRRTSVRVLYNKSPLGGIGGEKTM